MNNDVQGHVIGESTLHLDYLEVYDVERSS